MRLKFSLFFCLWVSLSHAEIGDPNPGPRSEQEASFLFSEGVKSLDQKEYKQASRDLKRLIDRYPTFPKINEAYTALLSSLLSENELGDLLAYGQELVLKRPDDRVANKARAFMSEAALGLKDFLKARTLASELLQHHPDSRQTALAYSIRFQAFLEEKQYLDSRGELDRLRDHLEKEPNEVFQKKIPGFKMLLLTRECMISHLLKNKEFTDDELIDYFSKKNICLKGALPGASEVSNATILQDWCEANTSFNHELQKLKIDPFLKNKIDSDLKSTFEFAKGINPDLIKCYAPYTPPKSKKRHRKRRH